MTVPLTDWTRITRLSKRQVFGRLPRSRPVRRFLAASFVDSIGTGLYLTASALFFTRALGLSPAQVGLGLSLAGVTGFLGAVPIGRLSDRVGTRPTLIGLQVWRGACFLAYPFVDGVVPFVVVTCLAGIGEWGSAPVVQSLVGSLVARSDAVRGMSALTLVRNVGFTASALAATVVIATGEVAAYRALVLVNAASFLVSALLLLRLRAPEPLPEEEPRPEDATTRPGVRYLALAALNGLLFLHTVVLGVGLPLWIVTATDGPPVLLGAVVVVNTVLPILLQMRLSRNVDGVRPAAVRQRWAGLALAVSCGLVAVSGSTPAGWTVPVVLVGAVALTVGEIYQSIGGWGVSYGLSPVISRGYFLSVYTLGTTAAMIVGPLLITTVVLPAGGAGWAGLGVLLGLSGALVPLLARTAPR